MEERGLFILLEPFEYIEDVLVLFFFLLCPFAGGRAAADTPIIAEFLAIDVAQPRVGHEVPPLDNADELHHELIENLPIKLWLNPIPLPLPRREIIAALRDDRPLIDPELPQYLLGRDRVQGVLQDPPLSEHIQV